MASYSLTRFSSPSGRNLMTGILLGRRNHLHMTGCVSTSQDRSFQWFLQRPEAAKSGLSGRGVQVSSAKNLQSAISVTFPPLGQMMEVRQYSTELDSTDVQGRSLDKRIQFLIEKWYLDDAMDLVKRSVSFGVLPSGNTMVVLLKHLTDVGDVENSIELTNVLLEHHLVLKKNIFPHLINAFYNSGQIEDGIEYMELTYNATKKFEDIELLFALIATLTFKEFPDKSDDVVNFVKECTEDDKCKALAHLWKCYMLAEKFENADKLFEDNRDELKSFLPMVINEICQMKDKVKVDREVVMARLCETADLSKKQRAYAYESLLNIYESKKSWHQLLTGLMKARTQTLPLPRIQVDRHIKNLEVAAENETDGEILTDIGELKRWCDIL